MIASLVVAINASDALQAQGTTASADGNQLITNGKVAGAEISDPTLSLASQAAVPTLSLPGVMLLGAGLLALGVGKRGQRGRC